MLMTVATVTTAETAYVVQKPLYRHSRRTLHCKERHCFLAALGSRVGTIRPSCWLVIVRSSKCGIIEVISHLGGASDDTPEPHLCLRSGRVGLTIRMTRRGARCVRCRLTGAVSRRRCRRGIPGVRRRWKLWSGSVERVVKSAPSYLISIPYFSSICSLDNREWVAQLS